MFPLFFKPSLNSLVSLVRPVRPDKHVSMAFASWIMQKSKKPPSTKGGTSKDNKQ